MILSLYQTLILRSLNYDFKSFINIFYFADIYINIKDIIPSKAAKFTKPNVNILYAEIINSSIGSWMI